MDSARVEEIYKLLAKLSVDIDPDPVSRGGRYMAEVVALTRGYLNQVSAIQLEVMKYQHQLENEVDALTDAFEISSDELLAEDEKVKNLPALPDRLAKVNVLLKPEKAAIRAKKRLAKDMSHLAKAIRHRQKELDNTISAFRLQRSILDVEYRHTDGDNTESSRNNGAGGVSDSASEHLSDREIAELFQSPLREGDDSGEETQASFEDDAERFFASKS